VESQNVENSISCLLVILNQQCRFAATKLSYRRGFLLLVAYLLAEEYFGFGFKNHIIQNENKLSMSTKSIMEKIDEQEWLDTAGAAIQPVILDAFKAGGKTGKDIKNMLHGKWLGHPVHPMITDVPVGAWTTAAVLDTMELFGNDQYKDGADAAVSIGLVGAVGAAITGMTDWTGTTEIERKAGLLHGMLNVGATALYIASLIMRRKKSSRRAAITLSMLGYGITTASAYIGGNLVYNQQMGVDHTAIPRGYPEEFVAVLPDGELKNDSMKCVSIGKVDVLLARQNNQIFAIANTCSHLGGPLSDGELLQDCRVICPWHQSVFSLKDGSVIDGPATEPQPEFDIRVLDGQIEVRLKK
jgi:nitrite reductase/ring-hydroxylating ferredoxin subunit/uncharacterized membrane protein